MSKSMKRVARDAEALGLEIEIVRMEVSTKTAAEAAAALGVALDQIAKSIIFRGETSDAPVLFLTAGGNRVDGTLAADVAGEALGKADAAFIRATTGFAIGGVAPIGHLNPVRAFIDPRLLAFDTVWAAAGTPHHLFAVASNALVSATGAIPAAFTETRVD